jgi:hypothetical protein
MIYPSEVKQLLSDQLPELSNDLDTCQVPEKQVYHTLQCLVSYTGKMAAACYIRKVTQCMQLADRLYEQGNHQVRLAVENVFVFGLDRVINGGSRNHTRLLHALVPISLYTLYVNQHLKPGV